ncbi:metallophosphoesterase, partial [Candidatus Woesearchaeota archaeon]|nr:metallophosphoesterase [Candidatus Woesearchaeota archaeon]
MNITKDTKIIDLALYLTKSKTLIIADSHIGHEEALNKQGILVPRFQFKELILRLEKILKKIKLNTIIINGDIKHEFGTISNQEWRHTLRLIDFLSKHCKNLFLIKGNHDKIL